MSWISNSGVKYKPALWNRNYFLRCSADLHSFLTARAHLATQTLWYVLKQFADPDPNPDPDPQDPHVFGLLDPDPLVRGMDPDPNPDPSIAKQK
jgi:hypothetical protein